MPSGTASMTYTAGESRDAMRSPALASGWNAHAIVTFLLLFFGFIAFEQDFRTSAYVDFVPEAEIREGWSEGGSMIRQLATLGIGGFGALCLLLKAPRSLRWTDPLFLVGLCYLAYIAASTTWSIDPDTTRRRLIVVALFTISVWGFARHLTPAVVVEMTMLILLGYLLLGIAAEVALGTFRPWSGEHRFAGTTHPNIQARYLVTMCLAAWCVHLRGGVLRPYALMILMTGLAFLFLTRSRTSLAGFVFAFMFAVSLASDRWRSLRWAYGLTWLALAATLLALLFGLNVADEGNSILRLGRNEAALEDAGSLTGRLPLWEELWNYAEQRPTWGHGYAAFWTQENFVAVAEEIDWGPASAHSSFLECILDLGFVGLAIMLVGIMIILARLVWDAVQTRDPIILFVLAQFLYALVFAITEAGLRTPTASTFLMGLALTSVLLTVPKRTNSNQPGTLTNAIRN